MDLLVPLNLNLKADRSLTRTPLTCKSVPFCGWYRMQDLLIIEAPLYRVHTDPKEFCFFQVEALHL